MEPPGTLPQWAGRFSMIDVGEKAITRRRAVATGKITLGEKAFTLLKERKLPKGDAITLAEVAGIFAAKRVPELLPLCHPLSLEKIEVRSRLEPNERALVLEAEATGSGKTGYEMEAMVAVSIALLCVYDLVKGVEPECRIDAIRLVEKEGGKSGHWHLEKGSVTPLLDQVRAAAVTVSDRVSQGKAADGSGPVLVDFLRRHGATLVASVVLPDEQGLISRAIVELVKEKGVQLLLLTGGTGLGPRDVTPEAMASVWDRPVPGIAEKLRQAGSQHTDFSWLSRSAAGLLGTSLLIAFPGSPKAVQEGLSAVEPLLCHALRMARGEGHAS